MTLVAHIQKAANVVRVVPSLKQSHSQAYCVLKFPPTTLTRFVCFSWFTPVSCRVQMSRSNKHSFGGWATWQKQSVTGIVWKHMAWFLRTVSHPSPLLSCTSTSTLQKKKVRAMNRLRKTYPSKSSLSPGTQEAQSHCQLASHYQDTFNSMEKAPAFSSHLTAQSKFWGGGDGSSNHHLLLQNRSRTRQTSMRPWAALVSRV